MNTPEFKLYKDGALLQTTTTTPDQVLNFRSFLVGGDYKRGNHDHWEGAIREMRIWGEPKSDAFVLADFNATKADYGKS